MPNDEWISYIPDKRKGLSNQDNVPLQELRVEAQDSGQGYWMAVLINMRNGGRVATCPHKMLHLTRSDATRCGRKHLRELFAAETKRDEWTPGPEDEPVEAPLPLGARVEYIGLSSRDLENGVAVHRWDEGLVVHVEPPGAAGTEDLAPEDGYCIVRFHGFEGDEDVIWPRFDGEGGWRTRYRVIEAEP